MGDGLYFDAAAAYAGRVYVRFFIAEDADVGGEHAMAREEYQVAGASELIMDGYAIVVPKIVGVPYGPGDVILADEVWDV